MSVVIRGSIGVLVLLACSAEGIHADVSERFAVAIRLRVDPSLTSRRIIGRVKAEAEAIWAPYGVRLEWMATDDSESPANSLSLDATVERQFERHQRTEWPAVLGRVVVTPDAQRWRPIRVSFDATQRALALRTTVPLGRIVLDSEVGRALGRVLAHEIGHILLGPPHHDLAGLMRASFSAEELGEPDRTPFRLTCGGVDRLRGRLRALRADPQRVHQHNPATLDVEGARRQRSDAPVGASCIPTQSAH